MQNPTIAVVALVAGLTGSGPVQSSEPPPAPNGIEFPQGYQDWRVIGVSHRTDNNTLRIILGKMEHFFKKGDLTQVVSQFEVVANQIGTSDTEDAETKSLVLEIYNLKNQAMVITEFSKRSIKISGIVSLEGSPVAIINGRVFERGQMLDEEVKIQDIRPEEVEFIFRDVRIIRRWE